MLVDIKSGTDILPVLKNGGSMQMAKDDGAEL
jgi:hypothetical protein